MHLFLNKEMYKTKIMNMKTYFKSISLLLILFSMVSITTFAQDNQDVIFSKVDDTKMYKTIELAQMDRNLSTFVNLIMLSGLDTSMEFTDEHTLFIPTNEAFYKLSVEEFANLTNPKNRTDLVKFIQYHILPNKLMTSAFEENSIITTNENEEIAVSANDNLVTIGGAQVIKSNIEASNGIIHIVDAVIKPATVNLAGE